METGRSNQRAWACWTVGGAAATVNKVGSDVSPAASAALIAEALGDQVLLVYLAPCWAP